MLTIFSGCGKLELRNEPLNINTKLKNMKIAYTIKATGETGVAASGIYWDCNEEIPYNNLENAQMISSKLGIKESTGFRNIYPEGEYDEDDIENNVDSVTFETDQVFFEHIYNSHQVVVVTRHQGLVEYLKEMNFIHSDSVVITQVDNVEQIKGKYVVGVLPPHLAVYANKVRTIPLNVPPALRGVELNLEQVRQYAGRSFTYSVQPE